MAVLTEDYLAPLVRHLRKDPTLNEFHELIPTGAVNPVLGPPVKVLREGAYVPYVGSDSLWIFRGFDRTGQPYANVEGTGSCAITLEEGPPWSRKTRGKSLSYITVNVYYHCDPTRDGTVGGPIAYDARDKCISLHKRVSRMLHIADKGTGGFLFLGSKEDGSGALKLVSSFEGRSLNMTAINQGDGMVEGMASFEMEVLV